MLDAASQILHCHARSELKHLDVFRFDKGFERGKVNHAGPGRTMVPPGKLNIVDMEAGQPPGQRAQMHRVMNEAKVFLDLGVAGVVPVTESGTLEFPEK